MSEALEEQPIAPLPSGADPAGGDASGVTDVHTKGSGTGTGASDSSAADAGVDPVEATLEALKLWRRGLVCGLIVFALLLLDLWTKSTVMSLLQSLEVELTNDSHGHQRLHLFGTNWLAFMENHNNGAAWGQFANVPHLLIGGRFAAVFLLSFLIMRAPARQGIYVGSLVLILSGAMGNLYDNMFIEPRGEHPYGAVRDFIDVYFGIWDWHFPTFNVADSCISIGAVLLLLSGLGGAQSEEQPEPEPETLAETG